MNHSSSNKKELLVSLLKLIRSSQHLQYITI